MNTQDLKQLQKVELEILKEFHCFCQKHDLKYYLIGGALLGAVRSSSFIPWDDDIDVAMFREDYETLQRYWEEFPIKGYFLQSAKTDSNFARCILKLRRNDTHIKEVACRNVKMHDGIYIDIFPIDYLDICSGKILEKRAKRIRYLMTCRTIKSGYSGKRWMWLKNIIRIFLLPISKEKIDQRIYQLCTKDNNKKRTYAILWLHNYPWYKQIHFVDTFGSGAVCVFEGDEFIVPKEKEKFLKKVFGDNYMLEPPKEKQVSPHRFYEVVFPSDKKDL